MEVNYLPGSCLGLKEFIKRLPVVKYTVAERMNGKSITLDGEYDRYAECVKPNLIRRL